MPLFAIVALLVLGIASASAEHRTLLIAYEDADNAPWTFANGQGQNLDLLRRVAVRAGVEFQFRPTSWPRCLTQLREGQVDGVVPISFSTERGAYAAFPLLADGSPDLGRRLHDDGYHLYHRVTSRMIWDGRRLAGLDGPVAAQPGFSVVEPLKALGVEVDTSTGDLDLIFRKIAAGRVQVAALQTGTADLHLKQFPALADQVVKVEPPLVPAKAYYLAFSRKLATAEPALVQTLWLAIAAERGQ